MNFHTFECPACHRVSHHLVDVDEGYCGRCHVWWNRLAAGVYSNSAGELHLSLPELLVAKGWADTPDNREMLARVATEQFAELGVPVEVEDG